MKLYLEDHENTIHKEAINDSIKQQRELSQKINKIADNILNFKI